MAARRRGEWQKSDNYIHGCVWEYIAGDVLDHTSGSVVLMEIHFRMQMPSWRHGHLCALALAPKVISGSNLRMTTRRHHYTMKDTLRGHSDAALGFLATKRSQTGPAKFPDIAGPCNPRETHFSSPSAIVEPK